MPDPADSTDPAADGPGAVPPDHANTWIPGPLEVRMLDILAGPEAARASAIELLCAEHPAEADAVRRRFAEAAAIVDGLGAATGPAVTQIGPYRILATLGEGGMGTVYLVEQSEPVRRQAALKVVKAGMATKMVLARFELERQVLAAMDHESIAKVFDAGSTELGHPYFVMEYVDGVPLKDYCDRHRLTLEERIRLFQIVCAGVQHAHQKGVMHRDLKSNNVLVVQRDGRPVPKIIDFGLARATGQELVGDTVHTQLGQLMGTPEYMSPEQATHDPAAIDTRTDVYSLGVMLYELLSGELPFSGTQLRRAGLLEIQRTIREIEPPRPSQRVATRGPWSAADPAGDPAAAAVSPSDTAALRRTTLRGLGRALEGDLDWIVLKAMAKEPARRYQSATDLAADLGRYLHHEPVLAGPPSRVYRLRKFLRRYRLQVGLAASVLVTLAVVGGGALWMRQERADRRQEAEGLVDGAISEVSRLRGLAEGAAVGDTAPWRRVTQELELARLLAGEFESLRERIDGLAAEVARDRAAAERRAREQALDDQMRQRLTEIVIPVSELGVRDPDERAQYRVRIARYRQAFADYGLPVADGDEVLAQAIRTSRLVAELAMALDSWAWAHRGLRELQAGDRMQRIAMVADPDPWRQRLREAQLADRWNKDEFRRLGQEADPARMPVPSLVGLTDVLFASPASSSSEAADGDRRAAVELLTTAWRHHPTSVYLAMTLADYHRRLGEHELSRGYIRAALAVQPGSAVLWFQFGMSCRNVGDVDGAVAALRKATELKPDYPMAWNNLGFVLYKSGRQVESLAAYRKAVDVKSDFGMGWFNLGTGLLELGRLAEAAVALRRAVEIEPDRAVYWGNLTKSLIDQGKVDEAIVAGRKAVALGADLEQTWTNLGSALSDRGLFDEALQAFEKARDLNPDEGLSWYNLGLVYSRKKAFAKAVPLYRKAVELYGKAKNLLPGNRHPAAWFHLGKALLELKRPQEGIEALRACLRIEPRDAGTWWSLALALLQSNQPAAAADAFRKHVDLQPQSAQGWFMLGVAYITQGDHWQAEAACRESDRLRGGDPQVLCNLGIALREQGRFEEAVGYLQRGHRIGSSDPKWGYPSAEWVRQVEQLAAEYVRLLPLARAAGIPTGEGDTVVAVAATAQRAGLQVRACQLFEHAFRSWPQLMDRLDQDWRSLPAIAAALAGCGQGADAADLDDARRRALRDQALAGFRAELTGWQQRLDAGRDHGVAVVALRRWSLHPGLAEYRDPAASKRLAAEERTAWTELWRDHAAVLQRARSGK